MTTAPTVLSIALDETPDPALRPPPVAVAVAVAELSRAGGRPVWQEFLDLDEFLTGLGEGAELRPARQAAHPVHG
ncbi:hypothetical protein OG352_37510 [Streptomyces sp. NBC_01485]|uniref:hypothetical protein n=1 Tax=Streptomyces sp. NBC_01485 TaxID=2903884 RepID=UPI002E314B91|nr:hypothetical protein [Streptomyces sp. NBC_01485]